MSTLMSAKSPVPPSGAARSRLSPAALVVCGVLALSVVASFGAMSIAMLHGDPALPEQYHWEGWKVDRDFAKSQRARDLQVTAIIEVSSAASACRAQLVIDGPPPSALELAIVHAFRPELDQHLTLTRRTGSVYEASCKPVAASQWLLELTDQANTWSVRARTGGLLDRVLISALPRGD